MAMDGSYSVEAILKATGAEEFTSNFQKAGDAVKGLDGDVEKSQGGLKKMLGMVGQIAAGIGVTQLISAGFNAIRDSVGAAVDRVDTLNAFPEMMEAMGFSADESEASISRLVDGIDGLPTTLDGIAATTQQIAIMTGDIDKATETSLALNNAFLASGADSGQAERGLRQYVNMLAKGEVDMQSWQALQETMGVALNDTAKAFGFTGASAQNDLYDALKEGDITFDQFNDKIIELSESTGGFAERALIASEGIRTSMENIKTAIVRNVANAINEVDEAMQRNGFGSISDNLDKVKEGVSNAMGAVVDLIGPTIDAMVELYGTITNSTAFQSLTEVLQLAWEKLTQLWDAFKNSEMLQTAIDMLGDLAEAVLEIDFMEIIGQTDEFLEKWGPLIGMIVGGIGAFKLLTVIVPPLVAAFKGLMILKTLVSSVGLMSTASALLAPVMGALSSPILLIAAGIAALIGVGILLYQNWDVIKEKAIQLHHTVQDGLQTMVAKVIEFFTNLWTRAVEIFTSMHEAISGVATGIRDRVIEIFQGIRDRVSESTGAMRDRLVEAWNAIKERINEAVARVREVVQTGFDAIKTVVTTVMDGIKLAIERVWNGIKEVSSIVWTVIKNVILVIIGIIALSVQAVFNGMKAIITTIWNSIKTVASAVWGVIGETVVNIVTSIRDKAVAIFELLVSSVTRVWNGIKTVITTVVNAIRTTVTTVFNAVKSVVTTVWNAISTAITNAVNKIKSIVSTVFNAVKNVVTTVFNAVRNVATTVWNAIRDRISTAVTTTQSKVSSVFNAMKNVILTIFNAIRSVATTVWNAIKSVITTVVNAVKSVVTSVFNSVRSVVTTVFNAIRSVASSVWNTIKSVISSAVNSIRSTITSVFNAIRNTITTIINNIRDRVRTIFNALKGIVTTAFNGVKTAVTNGMNAAWRAVTGMFSKFRDAGANIVSSIAGGISSAVSKVTGAIGGVVSKVRNFLPWSPAKEGPLSDIHKLDFGTSISKSLERAKRPVTKAMNNLASVTRDSFDPALNVSSPAGLNGVVTHTLSDNNRRNPMTVNLRLGGHNFTAFVEDVSQTQGRLANLEMSF